MSLPFYTGQVPTAADFNALAVKADLASATGANQIGYGASTVKAALDAVAAPPVTMVNAKTGAVVLDYTDVGAAALGGDVGVNFNVKNATGAQHAVPLAQADARYAPIGGGGGGGVSSVGMALPTNEFAVTGSPVTGSGTLTATWKSQLAKTFLAAPTGAPGTPVFRVIAVGDVPTLNQNTTGTAAGLSTTLAIASGGTGQTSAQSAIDALTNVSAATNEFVWTKDTATGQGKFKAAAGGSSYEIFVASFAGADPTGGTDSALAFGLAVAAAGSNGQVRVTKGTWLLGSDVPACNYVIDAGVTFSGSGKLQGRVVWDGRFDTFPTPKQGAYFGRPYDPLIGVGHYNDIPAAVRGISPFACTGVLGGSQSLDNPSTGAMGCIGVTAFSNNNNTTYRQYSYGIYVEAHRSSGAGSALGVEIDVANHGSTAAISPSGWAGGAGGVMDVTAMLWLAAGGDTSGVNDVSCAMAVIPNGAKSAKGIVFLANSVAADSAPVGGSEYDAMSMPYGYAINWWDTAANTKQLSIRGEYLPALGTAAIVIDGALNLVRQSTATTAAGGPCALPTTCLGFVYIGIGGTVVKMPFFGP